jgi:hypothetical protein
VKGFTVLLSVVTPCGLAGTYQRFRGAHFSPEDGGSMFLRNVDIYPPVHTESQARGPTSTYVKITLHRMEKWIHLITKKGKKIDYKIACINKTM